MHTAHRTHSRAHPAPGVRLGSAVARRRQIAEADTIELLHTVWEQQREHIDARLRVVERAVAAHSTGALGHDLRRAAARAAHTLAGSVGMFGLEDAARIARELERELELLAPERVPVMVELVESLRRDLDG